MAKNEELKQGREEYLRKLKAGEVIRTKQVDPMEKAKKNPRSLRAAINAKCFDCCCFQRSEVKLCTAVDCPLYNLRPWQSKEID